MMRCEWAVSQISTIGDLAGADYSDLRCEREADHEGDHRVTIMGGRVTDPTQDGGVTLAFDADPEPTQLRKGAS